MRRQPVLCKLKVRTGNGWLREDVRWGQSPQRAGWGGAVPAGWQPRSPGLPPGSSSETSASPERLSEDLLPLTTPGRGNWAWGQSWAWSRQWPVDLRLLLCSMRRWQYSKATSLSRSRGGSRRLAVEAADSTDRVEPSSSDLSSVGKRRLSGTVWLHGQTLSCPCMDGLEGDRVARQPQSLSTVPGSFHLTGCR